MITLPKFFDYVSNSLKVEMNTTEAYVELSFDTQTGRVLAYRGIPRTVFLNVNDFTFEGAKKFTDLKSRKSFRSARLILTDGEEELDSVLVRIPV